VCVEEFLEHLDARGHGTIRERRRDVFVDIEVRMQPE